MQNQFSFAPLTDLIPNFQNVQISVNPNPRLPTPHIKDPLERQKRHVGIVLGFYLKHHCIHLYQQLHKTMIHKFYNEENVQRMNSLHLEMVHKKKKYIQERMQLKLQGKTTPRRMKIDLGHLEKEEYFLIFNSHHLGKIRCTKKKILQKGEFVHTPVIRHTFKRDIDVSHFLFDYQFERVVTNQFINVPTIKHKYLFKVQEFKLVFFPEIKSAEVLMEVLATKEEEIIE